MDEVPNTEQGLIAYVAYCDNQIKKNLLHNRRLHTRMTYCQDKLEKILKNQKTETVSEN